MRRFALEAAAEETGLAILCMSKKQANKPHPLLTRRELRRRDGELLSSCSFLSARRPYSGSSESYQTSGPKLGHSLLGNQFKLV